MTRGADIATPRVILNHGSCAAVYPAEPSSSQLYRNRSARSVLAAPVMSVIAVFCHTENSNGDVKEPIVSAIGGMTLIDARSWGIRIASPTIRTTRETTPV